MHRPGYKIVAWIFLILSVFSFVLAAPVAVQEVREAYTNAVDGGDNVKTGFWKRNGGDGPLSMTAQQEAGGDGSLSTEAQQEAGGDGSLSTKAQQGAEDSWLWRVWTPSQHQELSSEPNYASGDHLNPSFSSSESKPPPLMADPDKVAALRAILSPPPKPMSIFSKLVEGAKSLKG